jgi:response regulator RpfG family c-di-GMP phosphodiesterase
MYRKLIHPVDVDIEHQKTVLIVEDDARTSNLFEEILFDEFGCRVILVVNGKQTQQVARTERLDLILLDYLPPEMGGMQVFEILQASPSTRSIPVLFMTSAAAEQAGTNNLRKIDHIVKPFDLVHFVSQVQMMLYPLAVCDKAQQ